MTSPHTSIVRGALLGDAVALGPHWIYDPEEIVKLFGDFDGCSDPKKNPYHNMKVLGDYTHYGDQMMILVESILSDGGYDPETYMVRWADIMKQYAGYMDHATKETLANIGKNGSYTSSGSQSFDGSVIGRIAPLLAYEIVDPFCETGEKTIRDFVALTHNYAVVQDAALYFAQMTAYLIEGRSLLDSHECVHPPTQTIVSFINQARASLDQDTTEAIQSMGPACGIDGVFQGALHCILKYQDDFKEAILANTRAGGDSASRGMIIGMVLGASLGESAFPQEWVDLVSLPARS